MFRATVLPAAATFQLDADQTVLSAALLGHADVATTMIYTHILKVGGYGVRSPLCLDALIELLKRSSPGARLWPTSASRESQLSGRAVRASARRR